MGFNTKISLDPRVFYQKLRELASKTKSTFTTLGSDIRNVFANIKQELSGANISFRQFAKMFMYGGGVTGLIQKGFESIFQIADAWMKRLKSETDDLLRRTGGLANDFADMGKAHQRKIAENNSSLSTLSQFQFADSLNNVQKEQQRRAIDQLKKSYHGLKIEVDDATGKIINFEEVQAKVKSRDQAEELRLVEEELKALQEQYGAAQDAMRGNSYFDKVKDTYGWSSLEEAKKIVEEAPKRLNELRERRQTLKTTDRAAEATAMYRAMERDHVSGEEKLMRSELRQSRYRHSMNEGEQDLIEQIRSERASNATPSMDPKLQVRRDEAEAIKLINDLEDQGVKISAERAETIVRMRRERATDAAYFRQTREQERQLQLQQLLLQGRRDEARELQIAIEYEKRGEILLDSRRKALLKLAQEQGSMSLAMQQKGEYESLYERALRAAGRDREADEYGALERARATKGGDLTDKERDATLKLVELTRKLSQLERGPDLGRMTIQANSLTARGGGGGKAVETAQERQIRAISKNTQNTNAILREIKNTMRSQKQSSMQGSGRL